ncbi:uncharacterized protein STEHIDRAFT_56448 [Stereum hirsutum FP-91666 SS1]|uniref:uncharacterized protein n=1 Tax=Stereum hirsutum (strain FP-91666) TaxID=721885 RepID=UPI000440A8D7|nr:uncharacterized protein STEHIDRAFT_56448 [Stereum hirsutum FP-91666 SS1]EIM86992.1 hypothetical protein STEHIDRAFT_56448 [Stereum hirsutum FP-91666 SS1]
MPSALRNATSQCQHRDEVEVLVVGAGPAGSMCAYSLMKAGVSVRIIDQKHVAVDRGHADALQPRVLEVLRSHGLIDKALKQGNKINTTAIWHPGPGDSIQRTSRIPNITAPGGLYPFNLTHHQGTWEGLFTDEMEKWGYAVERPFRPVALNLKSGAAEDPNAFPVRIQSLASDAQDESEVHTIRAKYLVAADGAHSWIRKSLGVTQTGDQLRTDRRWGVIDFVPNTDYPDIRCTSQVHSSSGFCLIVPRENDMVRLYVPLDDYEQYMDSSKNVDPDGLLEVAKKAFRPFYMNAPHGYHWSTIYTVGQHVADTFSVSNRIFLTGDAAHTHSPKAGQGMNASINDAHNIAWKLTYVLRGWASRSLLDTYDSERRKFALDLIKFDKQYVAMFENMSRSHIEVDPLDHARTVQTFGLFKNGIGIHYGNSKIVSDQMQSVARNLIVGRRFPPEMVLRAADDELVQIHDVLPSDTSFKLLIFTGNIYEEKQKMLVNALADQLSESPLCNQRPIGQGRYMKMVEPIVIVRGKKGEVRWTDVPAVLRNHWSKVFIDDVWHHGDQGGRAYENFGIDKTGAVVVVRPDGYVGLVTSLMKTRLIFRYFSTWACYPL